MFKRPNFFVQDKEDEGEEVGPVEVVVVVEGRSSEQIPSSQTNTGDLITQVTLVRA